MLEIIANELTHTNRVLDGIVEDVANSSPTIRPMVARYLSLKEGEVRARAALHFLIARLNAYNASAALSLAVSTELTYIANKIHKEIFYLDNVALHSGAAHLRVLTGDYLFSLSSIQVANSNHLPAMKVAIHTLGKISEASLHITFDQLYQRLSQGYRYDEYVKDVERRTGVMFESAAEMGCLLASVSPGLRQQLNRFAFDLGTLQHLAKNQAVIAACPAQTDTLPIDTLELMLVVWNELCTVNCKGAEHLPPYQPGEGTRELYQAAAQIERNRLQISQWIEQKKRDLAQFVLNEVPQSLAGSAEGKSLVDLVEIASLGQVN
jgi:hypothetical protein